ncbi:MAG: DNA repair protein RecN, partial [Alphaproteobacteria bacterium]|nr:DNA repair protein RecN [Alphaproteobacteria bacterium]
MLTRLVIRDVVLIEKLAVPFERGLNVFTGETGAGKSILLDALGLALGGRSDAGLIRAGADQASVSAAFELDGGHAVFALAAEQGLDAENPVILRRVVGKDGKSRAFFNDQPISVGLLKQFGESLLEIHGQFETHGLLNAATHRGLLDAFAGLEGLRQKTAAAHDAWKAAAAALETARATGARARAEEDFLRAAVAELEELAPQEGEADKLAEQRGQLQHREKLVDALNAAAQAIDGDRGAVSALAQAGKAVARVADKAQALPDILAAIDRAAHESNEASHMIARFLSALDADPDALQHIEERLFALRAAARKHNTQPDALPGLLRDLTARLDLLADASGQIAQLAEQAAKARHAYVKSAEELSLKRKNASEKLAKAIGKELPPLKLDRAVFVVDVAPLAEEQWNADGIDRVTFLAATNIGTAPGPLQKIASGGELARFMLALKTVLAAADPVPVLVFDEVDTGIGGAVASAVGERLAHLAGQVQVLVVTHSPQVAARGRHH